MSLSISELANELAKRINEEPRGNVTRYNPNSNSFVPVTQKDWDIGELKFFIIARTLKINDLDKIRAIWDSIKNLK